MATTIYDASAATFKIPLTLFDLPPPVPRQSAIPPTSMRAMGRAVPRRRIIDEKHLEAPSSGFREYMLFALKTRLTPELKTLIGHSVLVSYVGYPAPSMQLSLPGGVNKEPHINAELRNELNSILTREAELPYHRKLECLILRWNSVRYLTAPTYSTSTATDGLYERIPNRWLRSVLPFVPQDESFADDLEIPKLQYRDGGIYADCLHTSTPLGVDEGETYMDLYSRLAVRVLTLIRKWYDEGRIVDPEQSLVTRWNLESVGTISSTTMYKPKDSWGLAKLSPGKLLDLPVSSLLYDLAKGRERSVAMRVGINLVDYHEISKKLFAGGLMRNYHFSGGSLHFTPTDAEDLIRILNGVNDVLYGGSESTVSAVATLTSSRLSWINMYSLIVQRSISTDTTVYVRRDIEPMFVFSFAVPMITNLPAIRQEVLLRARRTLVYLMDRFASPGSLEPVDVHSLLDDPNTQLPADLSSPTVKAYLAKERPATLTEKRGEELSIQF